MSAELQSLPFKITVITPTYNRAEFLKETIESVFLQNDPHLEYIVIDDGSSDHTAEIIKPYLNRLSFLRHDNIGETATVNKGLALATGEWVAIINSDDPVLPGWLHVMRKFIAAHEDAEFIYPDWVRTDVKGNMLAAMRQPAYSLYNMIPHKAYPHLNCTIGPGMLMRRSLYSHLGGRHKHIKYAADMDLIYRAALKTKLFHVPIVLATHREHPTAASSAAKGKRMADDVAKVVQSVMKSPLCPEDLRVEKYFTYVCSYWLIAGAFTGRSVLAKTKYIFLAGFYSFSYFIQNISTYPRKCVKKIARDFLQKTFQNTRFQKFGYVFTLAILKAIFAGRDNEKLSKSGKDFVLIGNGFPPHWSGQAVVLGRILSRFDENSYAILALQDPDLPPISGQLACDYSFLKNVNITNNFIKNFIAWKNQFKDIVDFISAHKPAAVVVCSGHLTLPFLTFWACQIMRCKFFFYQFDDYVHQWWSLPHYKQKAYYFEKIMRMKTTGVIVPCEELAVELRPRFPISRVVVVRNPTSGDLTNAPPTMSQKKYKKLIFAGSLYHLNKDSFLKIVRSVEALTSYDVHIDVYSGVPKPYIETLGLHSPKLTIHPYVSPDEIHKALSDADLQIICLSHDQSSYPLVKTSATAKLADYLANGKPILAVVPKDSFIGHYVHDNQCGIVCSNPDGSDIAPKLIQFFDDPSYSSRMALKALECAQRDFDPEISANKLKIFLDVVDLKDRKFPVLTVLKERKNYNIVQISAFDQPGVQANGFLLHQYYRARGRNSKMIVHHKRSADPNVAELGYGWREVANTIAGQAENSFSYQNVVSLMASRLSRAQAFREADIVHIQLLHASSFLRWHALPKIFKDKKIVWTIHDMYMMTGHCVYSLSCPRFQIGCGECPDLTIPFPMKRDNTAEMFKIKKLSLDQINPHIIVGSEWMDEAANKSLMLKNFSRSLIPFGTQMEKFFPRPQSFARKYFGIPEEAHVISFRSVPFNRNFKGTEYIQKALELYKPTKPTYLLTLEGVGGLDSLREKYKFVELGWTENQDLISLAYSASDMFLMPSIAEAFGLMAIESLACGTPLIVFSGTALPMTANAPFSAIEVPMGDVIAFKQSINDILNKPEMRKAMSLAGLEHVRKKHDFIQHAEQHLDLYEKIIGDAV